MDFDTDYALEIKLIAEIKKHRLLYDLAAEDYKNANLKEATWNKIALLVCGNESSADKCKKKWKNLRDTYKRCRERKKIRMSQKKHVRDWKHEKIMGFLDKCTSMRKMPIRPYKEMIKSSDDDNSISDDNYDENLQPIDDIKVEDSIVGQCQSTAQNFKSGNYNADELKEDAMSLMSSRSSIESEERANNDLNRTQEENLTEFCAIKETKLKTIEKDSLSLLFESLDKKIHQANLSEVQMTEIESSVFSMVFYKLNEYRRINNKKSK